MSPRAVIHWFPGMSKIAPGARKVGATFAKGYMPRPLSAPGGLCTAGKGRGAGHPPQPAARIFPETATGTAGVVQYPGVQDLDFRPLGKSIFQILEIIAPRNSRYLGGNRTRKGMP